MMFCNMVTHDDRELIINMHQIVHVELQANLKTAAVTLASLPEPLQLTSECTLRLLEELTQLGIAAG